MRSGVPFAYRVSEILLLVAIVVLGAIGIRVIEFDFRLFAVVALALYVWHCFWWELRADPVAFASIAVPVVLAGLLALVLPLRPGLGLLLAATLFMALFQFGGQPVWRRWRRQVLRR